MYLKQRKIALVVGKTGYGKSRLVKKAIRRIDRLVIFDVMDEYDVLEDIQRIDSVQGFIDVLKEAGKQGSIFVRVVLKEQELYERCFAACNIVGNMTIVIEEISNFSSSHSLSPTLEQLVRFGRHVDISLIGISQRFADIGLLLRNNFDVLITFNLSAPNDIKYLAEIPFIGDVAYDIPNLPRDDYYFFTNYH